MKFLAIVVGLSVLLFSVSATAAELATDISTKLADPAKPFTLIVELPISTDLATEFKQVVKQVKSNEPKTLLYTSLREAGKADGITVVEAYADIDAFRFHLAQPYITAFIAKLDAAKVEAKIRIMNDAN